MHSWILSRIGLLQQQVEPVGVVVTFALPSHLGDRLTEVDVYSPLVNKHIVHLEIRIFTRCHLTSIRHRSWCTAADDYWHSTEEFHYQNATFQLPEWSSYTRGIQKVHRLTQSTKRYANHILQHSLLQPKCTWSSVSQKLGFHCIRIVDLGFPASHLPLSANLHAFINSFYSPITA